MVLLDDPEELAELVSALPPLLRRRVERLNEIADLAERALVRRLRSAAGDVEGGGDRRRAPVS
jgi:hypothetical protein